MLNNIFNTWHMNSVGGKSSHYFLKSSLLSSDYIIYYVQELDDS